jgi:hypothetical protein
MEKLARDANEARRHWLETTFIGTRWTGSHPFTC